MSVLPGLVLFVALLSPSVGSLALLGALIRSLQGKAPRFVSLIAIWLWVCGALLIAGNMIVVVRSLARLAFSSRMDATGGEPSAKARYLAEAIAGGMNFTALTVPVLLAGILWVLFWRWQLARPPR